MITLLEKKFIPDRDNIHSPKVRQKYGILCGGAGIFFNLLLFVFKFLAGLLSNSIAITADAFNNLSDMHDYNLVCRRSKKRLFYASDVFNNSFYFHFDMQPDKYFYLDVFKKSHLR